MRKQTQKALDLTADYVARALHFLIADGKLAIRDVTTALSRRKKLMKQIRDRFSALETSGAATSAKARKATPRKAARSRTKAAAKAKAGARATAEAARAKTRAKTIARSAAKK